MNHSELYFSANEQLRLENLIPITKDLYDEIDKSYWDEQYQSLSFEEWKAVLSESGFDINKIKKNKNPRSIRQYFYVGDYSAVEIHVLDPVWLLNPITISCLEVDELRKQDFLNKEYFSYFFPEWNLFALDFFIKLYKEIDKNQVWKVFKDMYTMADYGFEMIPEEVIEYVFEQVDNTDSIDVLKHLGAVDEEGYIKVYRGEGERSTPIERAYSWTLSNEVANRFANNFGKGKIYYAKVKVENVLDYNNDRNEEEILVRYRDIENLKVID